MRLREFFKASLKAAGLVRPVPKKYLALHVADVIDYLGDRPLVYQSDVAENPIPVADFVARPGTSLINKVLYTPPGLTIYRGKIDLFHSTLGLEQPVLKLGEWSGFDRVARATIVQTQFKRTYGDFVTDVLKPLAVHGEIHGPLLLPGRFVRRPYVTHEFERLGIDYRPVDRPVLIESALVLHKLRHLLRWTTEDVQRCRALFGLSPPTPRPDSLLFLSREGVRGPRVVPHREISNMVESMGGTTLATAHMQFEDYLDHAAEADTVVAEHGSAMINLISWRTRNVIEIAHDQWWGYGMISLAKSAGVRNHAIVRHSDNPKETVEKVRNWIETFRDESFHRNSRSHDEP